MISLSDALTRFSFIRNQLIRTEAGLFPEKIKNKLRTGCFFFKKFFLYALRRTGRRMGQQTGQRTGRRREERTDRRKEERLDGHTLF